MASQKRRSKAVRIILWTIGGLVALVIALLLYITTPYFAGTLGSWLTNSSGRNIAMEGRIETQLWQRYPRFIFRGVKIGNAEWAKDETMFEAESIEVSIDPWKLLRFEVVLPELLVNQPKLALEKNKEGAGNWDFTENPQSAVAEQPMPSDRDSIPVIHLLKVTDGQLSYLDPVKQINTKLKISTISGQSGDEDSLEVSGDGSYHGHPLKLDLKGASIFELRESNDPYPFSLKTVIGPTSADVSGTIQDPVQMKAMDVVLDLKGANAADLFPITGIALPPTPAYHVKGRLKEDAGNWHFEKFKGTMGSSDLGGSIIWHAEDKPLPYLEGEFISNNLDMADLAGFIGAHKEPVEDDRVIPDAPLDISRLMAMNADVRFHGKKVKFPDLLENFLMDVHLNDGTLNLKPLSFGIAKGTIEANVLIQGKQNPPPVSLNVDFKKLSLTDLFRPLAENFGEENVSSGRVGGKAILKGTGKSLREMLATSKGTIGLGMEGGSLSRLLLELAGLDIYRSAGLLLTGDKPVPINCVVADLEGENGVMQTREMIIDTDVTMIRGEGHIDFKDESLDLTMRVLPKDSSLVSARSPIHVTGKLKDPNIGIDVGALAARGGVATALGLLLPPAALLAFLEPSMGEDSNCTALIRKLKQDTGSKIPVSPKPVTEE